MYAFLTQTFVDRHANFLPSFFQFKPKKTEQKKRSSVKPTEEFTVEIVFCYQDCSDLLWEKKCSSDWEKHLKFKAEGREFAKFSRLLEQFIQTVKGQNNFW